MNTVSKSIAAVAMMFATPLFASQSNQTCQTLNCFEQLYQQTQPSPAHNMIHYAWRPGAHSGNSSNRRYDLRPSFGWFTSVPRKGPANSRGTIVFNPRSLTWAAYDPKGDLVKSGSASGGMGWCEDVGRPCRTPIGRFRVYSKGTENCVSRKYPLGEGGAPMPHCMFFRGGYALHGSYHVPNYNASHGCIRVHPRAAAWLHRNFVRIGTVVVVKPY